MLYDQDRTGVDKDTRIANGRYINGWDAVDYIIERYDLVPIHQITHVYDQRDFAFASGFEDACNHYMTHNLDEPDGKEWKF